MNPNSLLLPHRPLPPYSYVPGKFPHPIRDSDGHSYGETPATTVEFASHAWRDCEAYLRGIDLFNHGYYWEAHEAWEAVWNAFGRSGVEADFIKALIKLAAAFVKAREGRTAGVSRHAGRADELFLGVQQHTGDATTLMGLQFDVLRSFARSLCEDPERFIDTCDEKVVRFEGFFLCPASRS